MQAKQKQNEQEAKSRNQMRINIAKAVQAKVKAARKKACEEGIAY